MQDFKKLILGAVGEKQCISARLILLTRYIILSPFPLGVPGCFPTLTDQTSCSGKLLRWYNHLHCKPRETEAYGDALLCRSHPACQRLRWRSRA